MFMSASRGEGTSSIAASFSLMTAARARQATWLIDLSLEGNTQLEAFDNGFSFDTGRPGRAYDASLDVRPFYDVMQMGKRAPVAPRRNRKLLTAHQIGGTRLLVTGFRQNHIQYGERISFSSRAGWWTKLRQSADWIIVDAPALEASKDALKVVPNMDGVVIVVRSDATAIDQVQMLKSEVEQADGHILGIVMNQVSGDALIADKLAG